MFLAKPRCWRGGQLRLRPSRGARAAARVGAIAIQRMVHRKAPAAPACAQRHASEGGAAFWHSAASRGDLGPNPAAGEAGSCDYGPAAARGRQRALVRLRFSVWCIERHRHRRLVRKATQTRVGPLSGTRAASRGEFFCPNPARWRGEQTRERTSRGARSAARVGAIAIQRMVHRKASGRVRKAAQA